MDSTRCSLNWGQSLSVGFPRTFIFDVENESMLIAGIPKSFSCSEFRYTFPLLFDWVDIHYYTGCERTPSLGLSVFKVRFDHNFCQMVGSHCIMHETPGCFIYLLPENPPLSSFFKQTKASGLLSGEPRIGTDVQGNFNFEDRCLGHWTNSPPGK